MGARAGDAVMTRVRPAVIVGAALAIVIVNLAGHRLDWRAMVLFLYLVLVGVEDLLTHRIPNWLTVSGAVAGLVVMITKGGIWPGIGWWAAGLGAGLGMLMPFYLAGGMGAGDVKALAGLGALTGFSGLLASFVYATALGGIVAVVLLLQKGLLGRSIHRMGFLLTWLWGGRGVYVPPSASERRVIFPYGTVLSLGGLLYLFVGSPFPF